jgi:hypothetical protein
MKRPALPVIIDATAFFGFVALTTTGVLLRYILPPGSGRFSTIWGLDRHQWGAIHFWIAVAFFSILAVHLALHWRWVRNVMTGRPREGSGLRAGLGVVGLAAGIALAASPLLAPVERDVSIKGASSPAGNRDDAIAIHGSMTLRDVEATTGVPAAHIIKALKLPESISADEQLGPLRRKYGFEMNDVREIVKTYQDQQ